MTVKTCKLILGQCLSAAALVAVCALPAAAQSRQGFSFGLGAGIGGSDVTCDDCGNDIGDDVENGPTFYARIGHAANPHVVGGIELNVWGKTWDGFGGTEVTTALANLTGTLQLYPSATGGFYVKGGLGMTRAAVKIEGSGFDDTDTSDIGWGYQFGAGWDIPIGSIAITPEIAAWAGRIKEFEGLTGWRHAVVQATIGITFP